MSVTGTTFTLSSGVTLKWVRNGDHMLVIDPATVLPVSTNQMQMHTRQDAQDMQQALANAVQEAEAVYIQRTLTDYPAPGEDITIRIRRMPNDRGVMETTLWSEVAPGQWLPFLDQSVEFIERVWQDGVAFGRANP